MHASKSCPFNNSDKCFQNCDSRVYICIVVATSFARCECNSTGNYKRYRGNKWSVYQNFK